MRLGIGFFVGVLVAVGNGFIPPRPQVVKGIVENKNSIAGGMLSGSRTQLVSTAAGDLAKEGNEAPPLAQTPPRKICLLVEPTPFTHVSGYSNRFNEMLRYLSKAGDNVEIVTTDGSTNRKELPKERFGFLIHHTLGFTFPLYRSITLTFDIPRMMGKYVINKIKPDLIHATSPGFFLFAAAYYAHSMKIPLLLSYHTHLPTYGRNYLSFIPFVDIEDVMWKLIRFGHSLADLTLVTSPQMKDELEANGVERVDVWRKGIDTVRFNPHFKSTEMREQMTDGNPDDFLMVYVGRLGIEKRLKDLRPVLDRMPKNTRLCIVGKGPHMEELKEIFQGTNTIFTGQLSGDQLSSAFASADVFLMPSDSETLGFVVLESMASGVPVIGARAGGIPDIIDDGETGHLVDVGDTDAYVACLSRFQKDPQFRSEMGKRARKEAEKWGWEAATSILRNIQYEKTLVNFQRRLSRNKKKTDAERPLAGLRTLARVLTMPIRAVRTLILLFAARLAAITSQKKVQSG